MSWEEAFKKKIVMPEEAISRIKNGDRVCFVQGNEPQALGLALAARFGELENVTISVRTPGRDFGWYDEGWEASFAIEIGFPLPIVRQMIAEKRCDIEIGSLGFDYHGERSRQADCVLLELSPPDSHGYCSFGASCWTKLSELRAAKFVIAEINKNLIRTYGNNHVHVSEIDLFVEHTPSGKTPGGTDLLGRKNVEAGPVETAIAGYVSTLINDGDTIQIGVGSASEWCARLNTFDGKNDLGWHSEATPRGIIKLMREGVITSKYKSFNRGKHICTACGGGSMEDMQWVTMNPIFELHPAEYVLDVRIIAQHDNMKAINAAVAVDLTGQVGAESVGPRIMSGAGGQTTFALAAGLSRGGRSITVLPSTASNGTLSRIVPMLETGTIVTVPRIIADTIVTEYGIARLKGLTQRQRALELISIAHPDHRAELKKQAEGLYWP
ncbi:MAG TPA: acetyl-CoA hydrolase/transferase C-terminal domain-containing protein [Dehalococcoidales bacterium]|nr:acetyl-CoA hydrolase/transferase C-terminal domain-containing protein [Dehalococcoidales bacterium]